MRHICIKCGLLWSIWYEEEDGEVTSDLCEDCLKFWIRGKQKTEGNHDCYGRAVELCSRNKCKWFQMCCEEFLIEDMLEEKNNE